MGAPGVRRRELRAPLVHFPAGVRGTAEGSHERPRQTVEGSSVCLPEGPWGLTPCARVRVGVNLSRKAGLGPGWHTHTAPVCSGQPKCPALSILVSGCSQGASCPEFACHPQCGCVLCLSPWHTCVEPGCGTPWPWGPGPRPQFPRLSIGTENTSSGELEDGFRGAHVPMVCMRVGNVHRCVCIRVGYMYMWGCVICVRVC